ncbi:MAG: peptidase M61 [Burkholderiales bacterium 28-67-8]|nr:MAG: peptidase M61 [Burkholderiales bacterium 28-67-8]
MISYRIDFDQVHAHLLRVTLTVPEVVPLAQIDKATWQAECSGRGALVVSCLVHAFDNSVRAAFVDAQRGFFNGTSVCLRVEGREAESHRIELRSLPRGWQVATAMPEVAEGAYESANYDELVDHPFELGAFWRGSFRAHGVPHDVVVAGALPDFDGKRLLADAQRICEAAITFWHGQAPARREVPFKRYVFLLNAVEDGYGGLEHRASTALIAARRDLPRRALAGAASEPLTDGYVTLLGLISHEYFHSWSVKRLRPHEFERYDYTGENYTELLWFFEGFTSYYDDLLLVRAGLIDAPRYLKAVSKTLGHVLGAPGRHVQSLAQASFDAWVKYYRADENSPNATVSYYTKGSLLALALDLSLRAAAPRRQVSLDDVMRGLWARSAGGPIREADIVAVLREVAGPAAEALVQKFDAWVHGTGDLPLAELLRPFGVQWQAQPATLVQQLAIRVNESALTGIKVSHVLRGGAGERAGLSPGDEVLALDDWRLRRLDDAQRLLAPGHSASLLVARDQRLLTLKLERPAAGEASGSVTLLADAKAPRAALALRRAWIDG